MTSQCHNDNGWNINSSSFAKSHSLMTFDLEHQTVPISMVKCIEWFQPQKLASLRLSSRKPRLSGTLWLHCQWHPQLGQVRKIDVFLTSAVSSRKMTVKLLASRISASIFHHGPTSSHSFSHIFPNFDLFLQEFSSQRLRVRFFTLPLLPRRCSEAPCWSCRVSWNRPTLRRPAFWLELLGMYWLIQIQPSSKLENRC